MRSDEFEGFNIDSLDVEKIPVYRLKSNFPIIYRCAIAQQVSENAEELAGKIVERLSENGLFSVEIRRSPWIDFRWRDRALASIFNNLLNLHFIQLQNCSASGFNLWQYAHARCLSVLYSASRGGLIALHPSEKCQYWQWCEPTVIHWLKASQWRLQHPAETALIAEIIDLCDRETIQTARNWEKQALNLGQKILACDRACRIWGQPLDLARARLGLIAVAQRLLGWLLQEKLTIIPWVEC